MAQSFPSSWRLPGKVENLQVKLSAQIVSCQNPHPKLCTSCMPGKVLTFQIKFCTSCQLRNDRVSSVHLKGSIQKEVTGLIGNVCVEYLCLQCIIFYLEAIEREFLVVYVRDVDLLEDVGEHVMVAVGAPESQPSSLMSLNSLDTQKQFQKAPTKQADHLLDLGSTTWTEEIEQELPERCVQPLPPSTPPPGCHQWHHPLARSIPGPCFFTIVPVFVSILTTR